MENLKLVVRNIIGEPIDGYVRVTVSNELFRAIYKTTPWNNGKPGFLTYKAMADQAGKGIRIYNFNGVELCASYDQETRKTIFLMKVEDAQSHLLTVAQERAAGPKLPFDSTRFDRSVVATA